MKAFYANAEALEANLALMSAYIDRTRETVMKLPIRPASPASTDRMLVVFLPNGFQQEEPAPPYFGLVYSLRATLERLGPRWGLQVFYDGQSSYNQIVKELGSGARNTIFTPIVFSKWTKKKSMKRMVTSRWGDSNKTGCDYNYWRSSPELYQAINPKHEHLLFLEGDALLLKSGCVDRFMDFALVGAPWAWWPFVGNGGFTLRHRSVMLRTLEAHPVKEKCRHEDEHLSRILQKVNETHSLAGETFDVSIPSIEEAKQFAVETMFYAEPCAIHKPWLYMKNDQLRTILSNANEDTGAK